MVYISPITLEEVSKATYYRHMKKSQSQSQSHVLSGNDDEKDLKSSIVELFNQGQSKHAIAMELDLNETYVDDVLVEFKSLIKKSQSQSQSHETFSSLDSQYDALFEVFKRLFVAASSRGIPKKIVLECEKFL